MRRISIENLGAINPKRIAEEIRVRIPKGIPKGIWGGNNLMERQKSYLKEFREKSMKKSWMKLHTDFREKKFEKMPKKKPKRNLVDILKEIP